jgi:lysine-N-methylase
MTRFRCLASDCEATCCGGGAVPVERSTHRRLTLLAEGDVAATELLTQGIELLPQGPDYARLRFLESGDCSMLDGAGLCRVQSKFGHDALFDVCATYPRYMSEVDGEVELFGTLSCPEVARLALLADDGFEQDDVTLEEAPRKLRNRFRTDEAYFKPFWLVRARVVQLLANSDLALSEKLFVTLWMADKLRSVLHAGCKSVPAAELEAALGALNEPRVLAALTASFRGLVLEGWLPLSVILRALPPHSRARRGAQTERFDQLLVEVWSSYGVATSAPPSDAELGTVWERYLLRAALVESATKARVDVCLTRYAINHLATTPYMLSESIFSYAYDLVVRVAALRFFLTARLAGFRGSPSEVDARIVEVTYAFVRAVEHAEILVKLQKALEAQGLGGLAHAVCFLAL